MKKCRFILIILGLALTSYSCSSGLPKTGMLETGTYRIKLDTKISGEERNYHLHIPSNFDPTKKMPLILVIHGAFSNAKKMEQETRFSNLADREGFIVAYPNGGSSLLGFLQHWNADHCCGRAARKQVDDIGFLLGVIEDIHSRFNIDKSKIYMVGFSNGGMLTYLFASKYTEILAAAAPLAASIGSKRSGMDSIWMTPKPKTILPLIVFHARDDQNVPYEGGISPKKKKEREYLSVSESVDFWVDNNQCNAIPSIETLHSEQVIKKTWTGTAEKNKVILYTIAKWGHRWPGHYYTDELTESDPYKGFDAAEIIWDFFKQYSR